jgi:hypothetical protein
MNDRPADTRTLNFAGDIDKDGQPLPMTIEILRARTEKWPMSPRTPDGVAAHLARARQMFIDGYYTYENFMDAATRSLQAVEAALRVRFAADDSVSFFKLIERVKADGLVTDGTHEILHLARTLRNKQIHATSPSVVTPAIAAQIIGASHQLVAAIFD